MRGSIIKRSEGSWTIILDMGRDPATGKRRQQWLSVKGMKKQAEKRLAEMIHQADTGGFVKPAKLTVGDFLRQWLRDYAATNVRPTTLESYQSLTHCHLIPALGSIPLTELRPGHLQAFYSKALTKGRLDGKAGGLSARSVQYCHRILSEALSHAVKWGMVARNVALAVDPPKPTKREIQCLDADCVRRVLESVKGSRWYPIFYLAAHTGMRRGECLGLRWKDVDLDMATLSVVQALHQLHDGRIIFGEPKTAKGKRLVALTPSVALELRAWKQQCQAEALLMGRVVGEDTLVFSNPDGSPYLPESVTHAFGKAAKALGLDGYTFHSLRHSHASILLRSNIHPKIVQERLGHANIGITLDTYSHVAPGLQAAAAQRFEEALSGLSLARARSAPE